MPTTERLALDARIIGIQLASFPDPEGDIVVTDPFMPDDVNPNAGMARFVTHCEDEGLLAPATLKMPYAVADLIDGTGDIIADRAVPNRAAYDQIMCLLTPDA